MKKFTVFGFMAALAIALLPVIGSATPITLDFYRITAKNLENIAGQLHVTVWDQTDALNNFSEIEIQADEVLFTFTNNVGIASSISEVYFDDGTIYSQSSLINSLGGSTDFGIVLNPGNLPSGNTISPPFVASVGFGADAQGNPDLGVDADIDILGIVIQLQSGLNFADVANALENGDLRIGMHVRSIGQQGESDSFVNTPYDPDPAPTPVPEPSSLLLIGTGIAALGVIARRKINR